MYVYTLIQSFEMLKAFFPRHSHILQEELHWVRYQFPEIVLGDLVTVILIAVCVLRVTDMHYRYCIWFVAVERGADFVYC
jgi:hypothetical protein